MNDTSFLNFTVKDKSRGVSKSVNKIEKILIILSPKY